MSHPAAQGRHPLPGERAVISWRAPARLDLFPLPTERENRFWGYAASGRDPARGRPSDSPGEPDGEGDALEILGCLQVTDLPQVAGLLHPAELVFIGERPSTYDWALDLYERLGTAERFRQVSKLADWQPL